MPRILLLVLAALLAVFLVAACDEENGSIRVVGSGNLVTQTFAFDGFDALDLSSAFETDVTVGDFSITLEADDNLIEFVEIDQVGDTLRANLSRGLSLTRATLRLDITMPDVERIDASGAVQLQLFDFASVIDRRINLSGASRIEATLNAGRLRLDLSGASHAILSGVVDDFDLTVSGASSLAARDVQARLAEVEISGASDATLTASQEIRRIGASGASSLIYYGDPVIGVVSTSGAATVTAR